MYEGVCVGAQSRGIGRYESLGRRRVARGGEHGCYAARDSSRKMLGSSRLREFGRATTGDVVERVRRLRPGSSGKIGTGRGAGVDGSLREQWFLETTGAFQRRMGSGDETS